MEKFNKAETLRKKANVSYEEAKAALEQNGWDLMDAMIYLEKAGAIQNGGESNSNKEGKDGGNSSPRDSARNEEAGAGYTTRKEPRKDSTRDYVKQGEGFLKKAADWVARMISLGNSRMVVMRRKGQKVFEIPVTAAVLLAIVISPVFWPALLISLFMGCSYNIANQEKDEQDIREAAQAAEELNQRHTVNSFEV